jgi:hypothetical protein
MGRHIYQFMPTRRAGYLGAMNTSSLVPALAGAMVLWLAGFKALTVTGAVTSEALRRAMPQLQDGDLIFIRQANPIFLRVAQTTGSWETHVGILFSGPNGTWQVAESRFPFSTFSPLEKFAARSEHGRFYISRYHTELSPEEKGQLRRAARARMGRWYDLGFNYDSRRLYCSKFVFEVYREGVGVQVGNLTTFRQLLADNPQAPLGFWRLWFFGRIPWDRQCVTTTSELKSPQFRRVCDSSKPGGAKAPPRRGNTD